MPKHPGKSDKTIEDAVADALKSGGRGDFAFELTKVSSPNPGKITYHVTLTGP